MKGIDYLAIGHVTKDLLDDGTYTVGGTVSFSGQLAHTLGYKTAVLTSAAPDYELAKALPHLQISIVPATETTTFSNIYTAEGRIQKVHGVASGIGAEHIPTDWHNPRIVHLGPLVNRIDPNLVDSFPRSIIGLTPQGWLRRWDKNGRVYAKPWSMAEEILPKVTAVILSKEDLLDDDMLNQYRKWAKLLVMTQGWDGCTIFQGEDVHQIPAPSVKEIEPTGAGDLFATAFLIKYMETAGDAYRAGQYANQIAALSVTQIGLEHKLNYIQANLFEAINESKL